MNFCRVYQRINKISEMNTRLIWASKMNSKKSLLTSDQKLHGVDTLNNLEKAHLLTLITNDR